MGESVSAGHRRSLRGRYGAPRPGRGRPRVAALGLLLVPPLLVSCDAGERGAAARRGAGAPATRPATENDTALVGLQGVIAFNSTSEAGIVLLDPATGARERLTEGFSAEWSRGGGRLSFMRAARIFVIAPDGSGELELGLEPFHFEPPYVVRPMLSPDGDLLVYSRQGDIEVSGLEGSGPTFLMPPGPEDDRMPAWSPSGRHVAFVRDGDIHVVGADGVDPVNLTGDAAQNLDPDWSPDGAWIAYSSARTGDTRLWRIRVDGTERRRLTGDEAPGHEEYHPSWSPTGAQVVFERWGGRGLQDADIHVVTVDGGAVHPLVVDPGFDGQPSWGPGRRR